MGYSMNALSAVILSWFALSSGLFSAVNGNFNYKEALTKAIMFFEAQRSGKLTNSRLSWRGDSALDDGKLANVGDPVADHQCWIRPENMETPRTLYKIDERTPGTEIAAETAAAMAASSLVFASHNRTYSNGLLNRAKWLFEFAKSHKGTYDGECPFYCSNSGYNDELLWAASWLYLATRRSNYLKYITEEATSSSVDEFSWDLKYAGAQILLTKLYLSGKNSFKNFKSQADSFICSVLPDSPYHQVYISPGGMIHLRDGANTQYVTGTAFLFSVYSDVLTKHQRNVTCGTQRFGASHLMKFAKQQMDYLLGNNPLGRSYMVGFGNKPPTQAHHRGASVPILPEGTRVNCAASFSEWFNKDAPNPNELTGAILGGPDRYDKFEDKRWDSSKLEPTTYINSLAIGVLAKLAGHNM
ncbi:hypothetical protein MRB53_029859 [Persea americana]|uniref:Uncharacterized protein n=1 Tax=Persea americana TaxID=3435 RepID=A0ACC2KJK5_PERAE|nr:hypothetical protein MRB53_029859 [Persea americana]